MIKIITIVIILACVSVKKVYAQDFNGPDTVSVQSGKLTLKGLLWRPAGHGPFPTIIFCHGSYRDTDKIYNPVQQISSLGPVFASRGFIYFGLFRRGIGLSAGQGVNSADLMDNAFKERGQEGRNEVQLQQMLTDQFQDMVSGLKYLRGRKDVDTNRIAIVGHSFGGSLTLLVAEHPLKSCLFFQGQATGNLSSDRARLIMAVKNLSAPINIQPKRLKATFNMGFLAIRTA